MPGVEGTESEFRERLSAILTATPPLMQVLSVARHLSPPDWQVFSGAIYQPVLNHLTGRLLHIEAPFGLADLFALRLRPNPSRKTIHFARTSADVRRRWPEVVDKGPPALTE